MREEVELSDDELFSKVKSGEDYAFDLLFKRYYTQLCIMGNTHLKNKDAAKDIVQELFLEIYEKCATITITSSLKSYLYKSVYYKSIAFLKRDRSSVQVETLSDYLESDLNENGIEYFELQAKIDSAIESLPPQCKKIFTMNRFEKLKYKEIASRLNISVKSVEAQVGKALKILSNALIDCLPILLFIFLQK